MPVSDLRALLVKELQDLYSAEKQLIEALPKMIEQANDEKLVTALSEHLEVTKGQKERLEQIEGELGEKLEGEDCLGMKGIIEEGEKALMKINDQITKDVAIVASSQKVEHYEMAGYMGSSLFARQLELETVADLLEESLEEEKEAEAMLAKIAKGGLFTVGVAEKAANLINDETGSVL